MLAHKGICQAGFAGLILIFYCHSCPAIVQCPQGVGGQSNYPLEPKKTCLQCLSYVKAWVAVPQSFDVQRVLEGEKALRSDAARRLRDVEKRLAVHRNPSLILSSPLHPPGGRDDPLEQQRAELQTSIKHHSNQVNGLLLTLPCGLTCELSFKLPSGFISRGR